MQFEAFRLGVAMRADKPVHKDYWARFLRCIDILKTKKQRTVFRLTLVHGYNCLLEPAAAGDSTAAPNTNSSLGSISSSTTTTNSNTKVGCRKADGEVNSTLNGYASLVLRGEPDFIEIKGMTFCGGLDKESLSMNNVPRHHQVCTTNTIPPKRSRRNDPSIVIPR